MSVFIALLFFASYSNDSKLFLYASKTKMGMEERDLDYMLKNKFEKVYAKRLIGKRRYQT